MTADLVSKFPFDRGSLWTARSSRHRRAQASTRSLEPIIGVQEHWASMTEVLRGIPSPSSALLCTASGTPVASFGLPGIDLTLASRRAGQEFTARSDIADHEEGAGSGAVETVELSSGPRQTVIARIPGSANEDLLLSVMAEDVSMPLLSAWTRFAAEDLRKLLADQLSPRSSSAAV